MDPNRIFRKVSLDRLSSPEQLDQLMTVTTSKGWIALVSIGLLLTTALAWGVAGVLSDKVAGRGILVRSGGVFEVLAPASGRVTDMSVAPGDSVSEGQIIAWIAQPEMFDRLQQARMNLEAVRSEHRQTAQFARSERELQMRGIAQERSNLEQTIGTANESLKWLEERIAAQERLLAQGLITRPTVLATRQQYEQARERIRAARAELGQLELRRLSVENRERESVRAAELKVRQSAADVEQMERSLRAASQVTSPHTGRVLEALAEQGAIVSIGEPLLSLDRIGPSVQDLVAVLYLPSIHGKLVRPGMRIQIAPSTVRQEEYGMMLGAVTYVSSFPATTKGMMRVLKNEQLVRDLSGGGAPYEVHAELYVDPATPSQYKWSSSKGPPIRIQSGTLATASVAVGAQRPIAKAIPLFRKWTGT